MSASARPIGPTVHRILVVDDDPTTLRILHKALGDRGYEIFNARTAEEGLRLLEDTRPSVALLDIVLPGMDGLELLREIRNRFPLTEVVMMTSHASIESTVAAIREGAYNYLQKPFDSLEEVLITVGRAVEKTEFAKKNLALLKEQAEKNRELTSAVLRLSSLIEAGRAMGEFRSLPELLDFFIGLVAKELHVERASLMLLDPRTGELRMAAYRGFPETEAASVRVPLGEGIAGQVAASGQPFLVQEASNDPRIGGAHDPELSDSFLSVPIMLSIPIKSADNVLGVINVTNRQSGEPFHDDDLAYLSGLTGQLAVAIEGAKHFEDLQRAYDTLKETQDQLVVSERSKAIGQMAAGVAHDFNNGLSVILGRTQFALRKLENHPGDGEGILKDLGAIQKVALQSAETLKRVQEYTRIRADVPYGEIDLHAVVRDAAEINRPKWEGESELEGRSIQIELDLQPVPPVTGNFHELTQVVGNLIFNAVEAMPNGGKLSFRTYEQNGQTCLEVSDTGDGMSEQTKKQLFEPFFTTKETGQGLGMSIIYGIVARHRGEVDVESDEGQGTTVRLSFPTSIPSVQPVHHVRDREESGPCVRVLLVEDDADVRATYHAMLVSSGHHVAAEPDGGAALSLFDEENFDVVITDLSMPGISGLDVARAVKQRNPEIPVVLISGWAVQRREEEIREAGVDLVLSKPCLHESLLAAVQKAMSKSVTRERR